jgi:hypothetical protein
LESGIGQAINDRLRRAAAKITWLELKLENAKKYGFLTAQRNH